MVEHNREKFKGDTVMDNTLYEINGLVPCPRSVFVLLHNRATDQYRFDVISRGDYFEQDDNEEIVHFGLLSEFAPYFIFMDEDSMNSAADAVTKLAIQAVDFSLAKCKSTDEIVPTFLKRLFARTVRFLKRVEHGCFLTEIFIRKLWSLVYQAWKRIVVYRHWHANRRIPLSLATEFVC